MARECEVCGKKTQVGNAVETRGKAKYLGGVGTKVTGITRGSSSRIADEFG
jgi:large subunit ribosomal protein L28